MNQTFSLTRFARLNRWLWATKSRTYSIGAIILWVLILLILLPVLKTDNGFSFGIQRSNIIYFTIISLLLAGSIGSDIFSALFRQESAITYLMVPASRFEKFWLGVVYCLGVLSLLSLVFFGFEAVFFNIANSHLPPEEANRYVSSLLYNTISESGDKDLLTLIIYLLLLSLVAAIIGSFFFRRGVFVRNVGFVLMVIIGLVILHQWIIGWQFGRSNTAISLPFLPISVNTNVYSIRLSLPTWLTYGIYAGTLLMLWVIARIRFNEIER